VQSFASLHFLFEETTFLHVDFSQKNPSLQEGKALVQVPFSGIEKNGTHFDPKQ
jgi:hypothetical protein